MTRVTMDAVKHLHVKMAAPVKKCVTLEPEDSNAHARLVTPVTGVTKSCNHVMTSYCPDVTPMESTK